MDYAISILSWNAIFAIIVAAIFVVVMQLSKCKYKHIFSILAIIAVISLIGTGTLCTACNVTPTGRWVTSIATGCKDCGTPTCQDDGYFRPDGSKCEVVCKDTAKTDCGVSADCMCKKFKPMPTGCHLVEYTGSCQLSESNYDKFKSCETYWKEIKCMTDAQYDDKLAELYETRDTSPLKPIDRDLDAEQSARDSAKEEQTLWLSDMRTWCSDNSGILYDSAQYYCNGFQKSQSYTNKNYPDLDKTINCCIEGSLVPKAATGNTTVAGNDTQYSELLHSNINLEEREIKVNTDGTKEICFTQSYLCKNAIITGSALTTDVLCAPSDIYLCGGGCDYETAKCNQGEVKVGEPTVKQDNNNIWAIGVIVVIAIAFIALLLKWKPKR